MRARPGPGEANRLFITFEGPDGGGKTTQAALLVERLRAESRNVVPIHEPGGTDLGSDVRALLVRRSWTPIDPRAEALLFSACRAQLVAEVIRPSLQGGTIVVADRFADSTLAYQGAGRGLPIQELELLIQMATGGLKPDLTLLLDIPAELGLARLSAAGKASSDGRGSQLGFFEELGLREDWTRFEDEALSFHQRVRHAYLRLAEAEPERWLRIDASQSVDRIANALWRAVSARLAFRDAAPLS